MRTYSPYGLGSRCRHRSRNGRSGHVGSLRGQARHFPGELAGKLSEALDLVKQRSTRTRRSPLYAIEAQILLSLNRAREAIVVGRRGLELWPDDSKLPSIVATRRKRSAQVRPPVSSLTTSASGALGFYFSAVSLCCWRWRS